MAEDAVETARSHLVRVVAQTSIGDPAWTIGPAAAELIVMRLEALMDAKAQLMLPNRVEFVRGSAPAPTADPTFDAHPPTGWNDTLAGAGAVLPEGFERVASVDQRGQLPPNFKHDTFVEVVHRDGKFNKPAKSGVRPSVGEAALFNWKQTGSGDDIIGYRMAQPPEHKASLPKAVG